MLPDQLMKDSLQIIFQDKVNTVINQRDYYQLFPAYYRRFKQQGQSEALDYGLIKFTDGWPRRLFY